jgi:hypothetical protein
MAMLRRPLLGFTGLFVLTVAGCLLRRDEITPNWLKPFTGPAGADVIIMDIAVLEVPVGDKYINGELWSAADDQIVPPEVRKRLDENGLRVAKVCGRPPDRMLDLLTSERSNRNARQVRKRANDSYGVIIGPQREACSFQMPGDDAKTASTFEQANCLLQLTPQLAKDGSVQVQVLPQVQHADRKRGMLSPTVALGLQSQRPIDGFSSLRFDVPLGLNEYLIIGTQFDRPQSMGYEFFVHNEANRPVQRLLAVRAGRMGQGTDVGAPLVNDAVRSSSPAAQAGAPLSIP